MRSWLRTHGGLATTIVVVLATLVGGVAVLVPNLRELILGHPGYGWSLALIGIAMASHLWIIWDRAVDSHRIERLHHQEEVRTKDNVIADLERRLHPTQRDRDLFTEVLGLLPWETGTMVWLDGVFSAKKWSDQDSRVLYGFDGHWRERFMDDPLAQEAFESLMAAIRDLTQWMAGEGSPDDNYNRNRTSDQPWTYSIADGDERSGGWREFDRVREDGIRLARRVIEERRHFEVVGRQRGL